MVEPKKSDNKEFQRQGLQLFFQLSGWLIGPIVIALLVGQWLDQKYQTKPWIFFSCLMVAFICTCVGIVKESRQFIKDLENQGKK
ncbi:MAG: AtpZ/AtpI family protein [Candidatus Gribaldobacteria bacterium]|nr:AtpZ/AtpI family protein [Candidatus Gribaldobacteria bacterium]